MAATTRAPHHDSKQRDPVVSQSDASGSQPASAGQPEQPRRARRLGSRDAIREAAAAHFLEQGYQGTTMDEIAAAAHISKQTIYTHFADKETLFADLVLGNVDRVDGFVSGLVGAVHDAADVHEGLRTIARQYLRIVARPDVLRLRRLIIGEAGRFPELARRYYQQVPERVYTAFAALMKELADDGRLQLTDPVLAANHFAWLIIGTSMDRAMFQGPDEALTDAQVDGLTDAAIRVFMAAYGTADR
jgi:TetR/AcrR family transcriptional regulator, mexJK operon transcriptional repressor